MDVETPFYHTVHFCRSLSLYNKTLCWASPNAITSWHVHCFQLWECFWSEDKIPCFSVIVSSSQIQKCSAVGCFVCSLGGDTAEAVRIIRQSSLGDEWAFIDVLVVLQKRPDYQIWIAPSLVYSCISLGTYIGIQLHVPTSLMTALSQTTSLC